MGGHGGLNILPQKSWNVYGRENRLKVAQDEAQHAEEEKVRMEKQREVRVLHNFPIAYATIWKGLLHLVPLVSIPVPLQAESQARRLHLLQQAAKKRGEHFQMPQIAAGPEPAQQPAPSETLEQSSAAVEDSATAVAVKGEEAQPALLQHINFFAEHEARESHPEVHPSSLSVRLLCFLLISGKPLACLSCASEACLRLLAALLDHDSVFWRPSFACMPHAVGLPED